MEFIRDLIRPGFRAFLLTNGLLKKRTTGEIAPDESFAVFVMVFSPVNFLFFVATFLIGREFCLLTVFSTCMVSWAGYWLYKKRGKTFRKALAECLISPLVLSPFMVIAGAVNAVIFLRELAKDMISERLTTRDLVDMARGFVGLTKRLLVLIRENPVMNGNSNSR